MTSKLTREENVQAVFDLKAGYTLGLADVEILKRVARMALAAMDSEPVAYTDEEELNFVNDMACMWTKGMGINEVPLYRHAQPAPDDYFGSLVSAARLRADKAMRKYPQPNYVLNKVAEESGEVIKAVIHYHEGREEWASVEAELIDNLAMLIRLVVEGDQVIGFTPPEVCRAAMLQAGTLTNEDTKQAWSGIPDIDNAINMLDRIDTLESCDDDRIEAVKTVLRRLAGNSPVIPDGYVMVPKEMTDEIGEAIAMQANCCGGIALDIYDAMIAAAPHDTPALNSLQSVDSVTGGWIPVSERMPEAEGHYLVWANASRIDGYCDHLAIATYQGGEWSNEFNWLVTHWMPLPAAPQEVKSES
ncbi:DUF551 domain-containing protein [Klebsiella grimontii]|uniref:DUF551 domain-containing protein n=1 Tax=Klebsiella grimontii TaxID=2058152 RepID=UPI0009834373|nr:DUF551 domain-containing protein [Klebsiella grimontii]